jgi:hypothetical protein
MAAVNSGELFLFGFALVVFRDWHDEVGDVVEVGNALVVRMIGDDQGNLASEFAALVAVEQVLEAVVVLGDEDREPRAVAGVGETPVHLKFGGDGGETLGKFREVKIEFRGIELDAGEKKIRCFVSVLVGEQDVAVVLKNEIGNGRDHALAVGTGDEEDGGVVHKIRLVSPVVLCVPRGEKTFNHRGHRGSQGENWLLLRCLRDFPRGIGAGAAG